MKNNMEAIINIFQFQFVIRAFVVGALVGLCAALLGVSLVLKRYSNIGDGLSHVGFGITTIAAAFGLAPLPIAIPGVILAAVILLKIGNNAKIKSDSAIALISSGSLAVGIAVTSATTGLNTDVCNFMFGNLYAISISDMVLSIIVSLIVIVLFIAYYRKIFAITFDEAFSKAMGLKTRRYTNLVAILTAVVIVIGMRMMGTLLISSIIIFPAIIAMSVFKSYKKVVICSGIVSVLSVVTGIFISCMLEITPGALIVIVNIIALAIFKIWGWAKR